MSFFGQPPANQYGSAGAYYDNFLATPLGGPQPDKQVFMRGRRRRMNACAISVSVVVPWALFTAMYAASAFEIHYKQPNLCLLILVLGLLSVALTGLYVVSRMKKRISGGITEREPTWLIFLTLSMLISWVFAVVVGSQNYKANLKPYYEMHNMNEYLGINVTTIRGQQLMDAGIINFVAGTHLDVSKSMGFKSNAVYCVAPITVGKETLPSYDFWAVGTGCCSGLRPDFHCKGFNAPNAQGGLRLMADSGAFYRLAVQQAEAAYKIKAPHPLFFEWVGDAHASVESWQNKGVANCVTWIFVYFIFQSFLVTVAALLFAKLGQL